MKYYLDSEFMEDGKTIDLLSTALVCEDGREFYGVFIDADRSKANDWVKEHVIPQLFDHTEPSFDPAFDSTNKTLIGLGTRQQIRGTILDFCNPDKYGKPEFWGYYADYDWVAFCQLFGRMIDLPKGFPMYCRDIKQLAGDIELPPQGKGEHHALLDARWNKKAHEHIMALYQDIERAQEFLANRQSLRK